MFKGDVNGDVTEIYRDLIKAITAFAGGIFNSVKMHVVYTYQATLA
jgi:hypothetical protein